MNEVDRVNKAVFDVALRIMNEAFEADPYAIQALLCNRVPCNITIADHPTIIVESVPMIEDVKGADGHYTLGALGLINGMVWAVTNRRIASKWSEPNDKGMSTLLGFMEFADPETNDKPNGETND